MKKYILFGYQVEIDEKATKEWYSKSKGWQCDCGHCRNFIQLAKNEKLPTEILKLLKKLGVLPEKATYVREISSEEKQIMYQFSYRIAGNILEDQMAGENAPIWGEARCWHETYPYGAPDFPTPHFDLEFGVRLPWVLKYSFQDIADYLMHGREIEFVYNGKECSITNHSKTWWFYDGKRNIELCEFENFELLVSKVADIVIEDKTIREIFDGNDYGDEIYII